MVPTCSIDNLLSPSYSHLEPSNTEFQSKHVILNDGKCEPWVLLERHA